MNDVSGFLILVTIQKRDASQRSQIMRLSPGGRIERGPVEDNADAVAKLHRVDDFRFELEQIRFVVIQPFRSHRAMMRCVEGGCNYPGTLWGLFKMGSGGGDGRLSLHKTSFW